jgi:Protein of unknown function (DUF3168)
MTGALATAFAAIDAGLSPALQAVWSALATDPALDPLVPGGVHFKVAPQDGVYPVVLVDLVDDGETVSEFARVAYDVARIRVRCVDRSASPATAQQIADAVDKRLQQPTPLPMRAGWQWMATARISWHETIIDEADVRFQDRGGSYRVLCCPV